MTKRTLGIAFATLIVGLASTVMVEAGARRGPGDPLVLLSYDLEDSARGVARHVTRGTRWLSHRQERALQRLQALEREARQFRHDVRRYGAWSRHAAREYDQLQRAFHRARSCFTSVRSYRWNPRVLDRTDYVMRQLDRSYEMRLARYRHGHRHGRPVGSVYIDSRPKGHAGRVHVGIVWDDDSSDDDSSYDD